MSERKEEANGQIMGLGLHYSHFKWQIVRDGYQCLVLFLHFKVFSNYPDSRSFHFMQQ